jgi:hypothetical protein
VSPEFDCLDERFNEIDGIGSMMYKCLPSMRMLGSKCSKIVVTDYAPSFTFLSLLANSKGN